MYRERDHSTLAFSFCRKFLAFPLCKSDLQVSKRHFHFAKVICRSAKAISTLQKRFAGRQKAFPLCKSEMQVCIWDLQNVLQRRKGKLMMCCRICGLGSAL